MQSNIENFYRTVVQNPALLSKIQTGANTPDEFIDRAVAVAKDEGYAIDRTEAKSWIESQIAAKQKGELSDTQLEAVAGGKGSPTPSGGLGPDPGGRGINPGGMYSGGQQAGGRQGVNNHQWMQSW